MQKEDRKSYIDSIGIDYLLCHTDMGNKIYILKNGQKYKKLCPDYSDLRIKINRNFKTSLLEQTEEYGHSIVSFPERIIASDKWLSGIGSDFEVGDKLKDIPVELEVDYLLYIIGLLEEGTEDISLKGWVFEDLHEENILINLETEEKPVRIIDTDFYVKEPSNNAIVLLQNYKDNMARIFDAIMTAVLPRVDKSIIWNDPTIQQAYHKAISGEMKCSDFLKILLVKIKYNQKTNKTIMTLRKSLY